MTYAELCDLLIDQTDFSAHNQTAVFRDVLGSLRLAEGKKLGLVRTTLEMCIRDRIENCQIGVFLSYASPKGHALIDRRLYLPKDWIEDAERRKTAGVPDDVQFATKPKIGTTMVAAALEAGVPCALSLIHI